MALSKDEGTGAGRGRILDKYRDKGVVLYRSDFDSGYDGWTDHWDGYRPWPILSRTTEAQYRGSHSLMLSTGEHPSPVAGDVSTNTAAFRRMARHDEYRYHSFSGFFALGVGGFTGTWSTFSMFFDTQSFDSTVRSFFKVQCVASPGPNWTRWQLRGDGDAGAFINIPNSGRRMLGNNDNKHGMVYIRFTVDLWANNGLGGYHELQIGPNKTGAIFDLTGLGGASSAETPQWDGSNIITDFNGGHNIGVAIQRSSLTGGAQLFLDDVVYSATNSLA